MDDSAFFLINLLSFKNRVNTFKVYFLQSGLQTIFSKCKYAWLGSLKDVLEAVCSLKPIHLKEDSQNFR